MEIFTDLGNLYSAQDLDARTRDARVMFNVGPHTPTMVVGASCPADSNVAQDGGGIDHAEKVVDVITIDDEEGVCYGGSPRRSIWRVPSAIPNGPLMGRLSVVKRLYWSSRGMMISSILCPQPWSRGSTANGVVPTLHWYVFSYLLTLTSYCIHLFFYFLFISKASLGWIMHIASDSRLIASW